ncbi:MAG TPA: 5'-3' exonuclease H3TH domain-containing protein [Solirubrobacteraceae bacterium]|nr:5'-3' exonuclease H3TH domain-containing protein [Solirubrobacteraceae bacterium]
MPGPLLVADVPWLLYRSYFALPASITGADGEPVNALLGTVNALLALLEARLAARGGVRAVVACLGAEQATYRVQLYAGYHAQREPKPAPLASQWAKAPELLGAFGWTVAEGGELEADDVMFSYAHAERRAGGEALLLTGDRDLFAAAGEGVSVVQPRRGGGHEEIDAAGVRERYGVAPAQVSDLIALRGDPSDGLPGAAGIGAKTAASLLRRHGSLERVLEVAGAGGDERMSARAAATLSDNAQLLRTFKRVATLQLIDVRRPRDRATDLAGGARAARALGMRRLAERLTKLAEDDACGWHG